MEDNPILGWKKKKIVFLHPDLGIGGAERLIVDAGKIDVIHRVKIKIIF